MKRLAAKESQGGGWGKPRLIEFNRCSKKSMNAKRPEGGKNRVAAGGLG